MIYIHIYVTVVVFNKEILQILQTWDVREDHVTVKSQVTSHFVRRNLSHGGPNIWVWNVSDLFDEYTTQY